MRNRSFRRNNSGQVLIISALLVALILLSTALYVIQTEKNGPEVQVQENGFFAYQQSARNTVISGLANATNGGDSSILTSDLSEFTSAVTSHSYQSLLQIRTQAANAAPYDGGLWISWGTNGYGVSSGCCTFNFESYASKQTSNMQFTANVTSEISLSGNYVNQNGTKQVNLTVNVLNEGKGSLAKNLDFYFDLDGSLSTSDWTKVDYANIICNRDGSYVVSFVCETEQLNNPVYALVSCLDERGVLVKASVAAVEIGE
jgi:hypothetical protein